MSATKNIMVRMSCFLLELAAFLARRPRLKPVSDLYLRSLARKMVKANKIGPVSAVGELGTQWQKAFGGTKHHPIVEITGDTVYGEILTECPLRGSGDTHACHRMMEYDREVMRHVGAEFVVLRSQAQPGVRACLVAMRKGGADMTDLVPAHISAPPTA